MIATEQIYDGLLNGEVFSELPHLVAKLLKARSASLAWRSRLGGTVTVGHTGHFSDEALANYGVIYAHTDPWVPIACSPEHLGRPVNMDEHISPEAVRSSTFYREWIAGQGDDSIHSLAVATESANDIGIIGVLRGPSRVGAFTSVESAKMALILPHISRLLAIKGLLAVGTAREEAMEAALDAAGLAMIAVDAQARIHLINSGGQTLLEQGLLRTHEFSIKLAPCRALAAAIDAATRRAAPTGTALMIAPHGQEHLASNVMPFAASTGKRLALILIKHQLGFDKRERALRQLFGLTRAEAQIALLLSSGHSPAGIAERRGTGIQTLRSQVQAIKMKTHCKRQNEIIALINSLPI